MAIYRGSLGNVARLEAIVSAINLRDAGCRWAITADSILANKNTRLFLFKNNAYVDIAFVREITLLSSLSNFSCGRKQVA